MISGLFFLLTKQKRCKRQEQNIISANSARDKFWEFCATCVGWISAGYAWILWGLDAVSLLMSNAKAVPVVWNDFSFAGPLKDRHYDRMKKKSFAWLCCLSVVSWQHWAAVVCSGEEGFRRIQISLPEREAKIPSLIHQFLTPAFLWQQQTMTPAWASMTRIKCEKGSFHSYVL